MNAARHLPIIEKIRLAKSHPIGFLLGAGIGTIIPVLTLLGKIAGTRVNEWFYLLAIIGGCFSLMSLWSFGQGIFGNDSYGKVKTFVMCFIIEISWLALPYHIPPDQTIEFFAPWSNHLPGSGLTVPLGLQWAFLSGAIFAFAVAIAVNALETAATMSIQFESHQGNIIDPQISIHWKNVADFIELYQSKTIAVAKHEGIFFLTANVYINRSPRAGAAQPLLYSPTHIEFPIDEEARQKILNEQPGKISD